MSLRGLYLDHLENLENKEKHGSNNQFGVIRRQGLDKEARKLMLGETSS